MFDEERRRYSKKMGNKVTRKFLITVKNCLKKFPSGLRSRVAPPLEEASTPKETSPQTKAHEVYLEGFDVQSFIKTVWGKPIVLVGGQIFRGTCKKNLDVSFEPEPGKTWNDYDIPSILKGALKHLAISSQMIREEISPIVSFTSSGEKKCFVCNFFVFRKLKVVKCSVCENTS